MRRLAAAALAVAAAGCGGVEGLGDEAPPVGFIRGQVLGDLPSGADVRVSLVWADNPDGDSYCTVHGRNALKEARGLPDTGPLSEAADVGCADSLRFVPNRATASARVDSAGRFELSLSQLPPGDVMRGVEGDRIAYASLVAWVDVDGNGVLDIVRTYGLGERYRHDGPDDRRGRREVKDGKRTDGGFDWVYVAYQQADPARDDVILGASFVSADEDHVRVAYREGGFRGGQLFYPAVGCAPPPQGYSIMRMTGRLLAASCTFDELLGADVEIDVRPPHEVRDVRCGAPRSVSNIRPPPQAPPPYELGVECMVDPDLRPEHCAVSCVGATGLAISDRRAACPGVVHFDLCADRDDCLPEFLAPQWWPCPL